MENIRFHINIDTINIAVFALLLIAFTIFVYRFTLPPISNGMKRLLVFLRAAALIVIALLLFEPSLTITKRTEKLKTIPLFIDLSESVSDYGDKIEAFLNRTGTNLLNDNIPHIFYSFGSQVKRVTSDSTHNLKFDLPVTDFTEIFDTLKQSDNYAGAIIISDGNYNRGVSPVNLAEYSAIPIFTVGVGDTVKPRDISVASIITNKLIYKGKPTTILIRIKSFGFDGGNVEVKLSEKGKILSSRVVTLNESGVNEIEFEYTPHSVGESRLRVSVSNLPGELSGKNNSKTFYVNVLKGKINLLLITSSPTPDFSFIYNSLKKSTDVSPNKLIELKGKPVSNRSADAQIDSADVLALINFPSKFTSSALRTKVLNAINKNKPFFIIPDPFYTGDFHIKLKSHLGYAIKKRTRDIVEVQPAIGEANSPIINLSGESAETKWNNLPPVLGFPTEIELLPGANTVLSYKINNATTNFPLLIAYNLNGKRSASIFAKDIWHWKLQSKEEEIYLFDEFIQNIVKWLHAINVKRKIRVEPMKRVFSNGEKVEFVAEVYDERLHAVNEAEIEINVFNDFFKETINPVNAANGIYKGTVDISKGGNYKYTARIKYSGKTINIPGGSFTVENYNAEKIIKTRNKNILQLTADISGGKYYDVENANDLLRILAEQIHSGRQILLSEKEYKLWQYEIALILLIILFSFEWFLRKRAGLL